MRRALLSSVCLSCLLGGVVVDAAHAATAEGRYYQNAVGFCQAASPSSDANLLKGPLALSNVGTSTVSVSCSMPSPTPPGAETPDVEDYFLVLLNRRDVPVSVTCRLVHGFASGPGFAPQIVPKTVVIDANARGTFFWTTTDVAGGVLRYPNFSCRLPPDVDIGYGYYNYRYQIGS